MCFSCDYCYFDQNECLYVIFIMFGDIQNFRLGFEHDSSDFEIKGVNVSLFVLLLYFWCN